jgi:hypothetical protein
VVPVGAAGADADHLGAGAVAVVAPLLPLAPIPKTKWPKVVFDVGVLVLRDKMMDGWCRDIRHNTDPAHPCSIERTTTPTNPLSVHGRPAAWLLAWLDLGKDCLTREEHKLAGHHVSKKRSQVGVDGLTEEKRLPWRSRLVDEGHNAVLLAERPQRGGEPLEQPNL